MASYLCSTNNEALAPRQDPWCLVLAPFPHLPLGPKRLRSTPPRHPILGPIVMFKLTKKVGHVFQAILLGSVSPTPPAQSTLPTYDMLYITSRDELGTLVINQFAWGAIKCTCPPQSHLLWTFSARVAVICSQYQKFSTSWPWAGSFWS